MMDVTVHAESLGHARVTIDLGAGHELQLTARYDTDRHRNVRLRWKVPAKVTGPREEVRDLKHVTLATARLDLREPAL